MDTTPRPAASTTAPDGKDSGRSVRHYQLRPVDPSEQAGNSLHFERIGDDLKRVSGPRKKPKTPLPRGRPTGSRSKGWTCATRRTCREILEANKEKFQSMIHLSFQKDAISDPSILRNVRDRFVRNLRGHVPDCHFVTVLEFKERSLDPHFHVPITVILSDEQKQHLTRHWERISSGGEFVYDPLPDEPTIAIARYAQKSRGKVIPDWFASDPFRPYSTNLPRIAGPVIEISAGRAEDLGLTRFKLSHGGAHKLNQEERQRVSSSTDPSGIAGKVSPLSKGCSVLHNDNTSRPTDVAQKPTPGRPSGAKIVAAAPWAGSSDNGDKKRPTSVENPHNGDTFPHNDDQKRVMATCWVCRPPGRFILLPPGATECDACGKAIA